MTLKIQTVNSISPKGLARLPERYLVGNDIADLQPSPDRVEGLADPRVARSELAPLERTGNF